MSARNREGWDTALDAQTDLVRSFKTVAGRQYTDGLIDTLASAGMFDARTGELAPPNPEYAAYIVGTAQQFLPECDPFYISSDLSELVEYAAESFSPEPLVATDLIVPSGFAYFSKPLYMRDRFDMPMPFRAIQWCPTIDIGNEAITQGQEVYGGVIVALYDHSAEAGARVGGSDLAMDYVTSLRFNAESKVYDSDNSVRDLLAHLKVFFRLCQQTIAVSHRERVARPTWKRARATWKDIKEVVVFTLRRAKSPQQYEGEPREVQWSHRWIVQGHWRNQFYPSEKVHRQIWIAPHIRGPENKPIIFKRRAFELVR